MAKIIFVNERKCVGCMCCVLGCSLQHGDLIGPTYSMIMPLRLKRTAVNLLMVCRQCAKPFCADVCPKGAISRDAESGAVVVNHDLCDCCGGCVSACPFRAISVNTSKGHVVKCNLCNGDPLCVKFCAYGAIEYIAEEEAALRDGKETIGKLCERLPSLTIKHGENQT